MFPRRNLRTFSMSTRIRAIFQVSYFERILLTVTEVPDELQNAL